MKIKIKKCSVPRYWYANHIGESFSLSEDKKHEVKEDPDNSNLCYVALYDNQEHIVICDDCEVVHDRP